MKNEALLEDVIYKIFKSKEYSNLESNPNAYGFMLAGAQEGAKYQAERMYSEEEAGELVYNIIGEYGKNYGILIGGAKLNELFEQFKK